MEAEYLERLRENGHSSLSCFVEYMTPEEPPAEHHELLCDKLQAYERRDILRGTVSMPPGHAKTKFCSKFFPAWYLGRNQRHRYLQGGHSQAFCENEFGKGVRDIITDPRFRSVFPDVALDPRSTAAGNWKLSNRKGGYITKGVGQKLAGYRGHCGGVDDPFGSREDAESPTIRERVATWFFADFSTRFLPGSPIFIIATRWDINDLIGHVERLSKAGTSIPWDIVNLNGIIENELEAAVDPMGRDVGEALWPDFYTTEVLMEFKATLSDRDWWSLYKGKPRVAEGNVVKSTWLARYETLPQNIYADNGRFISRNIRRITASVDTANKNNQRAAYSVVEIWIEGTDGRHYLAEVRRKKVEFNELIPFIEDAANDWDVDAILVEDKGNGTSYIQQRQGKAPASIIPIVPEQEGSKEFRFDAVTPLMEAGRVVIPARAPWLADFEDEVLAFPNSTFKDQVDAMSQYLNWTTKRTNYGAKKMKKPGATTREMVRSKRYSKRDRASPAAA